MCWTDDQYIFSKPTKQRRLQAYFVDTCQSSKCIPGQVHPSHSKLHGLAHELLSRKSGIETWQICNIGILNVSSIFRSNYATVKTLTCKSRCLFHQKQDFDYIFSKHLHFFVLSFAVFMSAGSLRTAVGLTVREISLILLQRMHKVIPRYQFSSRSPAENSWRIIVLMAPSVIVSMRCFTT